MAWCWHHKWKSVNNNVRIYPGPTLLLCFPWIIVVSSRWKDFLQQLISKHLRALADDLCVDARAHLDIQPGSLQLCLSSHFLHVQSLGEVRQSRVLRAFSVPSEHAPFWRRMWPSRCPRMCLKFQDSYSPMVSLPNFLQGSWFLSCFQDFQGATREVKREATIICGLILPHPGQGLTPTVHRWSGEWGTRLKWVIMLWRSWAWRAHLWPSTQESWGSRVASWGPAWQFGKLAGLLLNIKEKKGMGI